MTSHDPTPSSSSSSSTPSSSIYLSDDILKKAKSGSGHTQSPSRPITSDNYRQPNTSRPSNLAPHNHSHFTSERSLSNYQQHFGNPPGYGPAGPSFLPGSINTPKHQDGPQRGAYERSLSNYQQHFGNPPGYGPAGPSFLPGSINTPKHQDGPQRWAYSRTSIQDDIELRGASDIVENDSPPTSFISSPGPIQHHQYTPGQMMPSQPPPPSSPAALALPPGVGRRNLSHPLPRRTPLAGVVGGSHELKKMIKDQEIETPVLSPEDSDVSYSI